MTIRPACSEDAEAITRTLLASAEHHARLDPERYFVPEAEILLTRYGDRLRSSDVTPARIMLVAEHDGEVVGFIEATLDVSQDPMHKNLRFCHVGEIAVLDSHRSKGIGTRLLGAVEDWGRRQGADFTSLEYLASNTRAGAFYQKMHYRMAAVTVIKRL